MRTTEAPSNSERREKKTKHHPNERKYVGKKSKEEKEKETLCVPISVIARKKRTLDSAAILSRFSFILRPFLPLQSLLFPSLLAHPSLMRTPPPSPITRISPLIQATPPTGRTLAPPLLKARTKKAFHPEATECRESIAVQL